MASENGTGNGTARAIALIGPQGSGKSTLFEALLTAAGAPIRRPDGRDRAMGTETRLGHCSLGSDDWAILDCPGSVEFLHDTACALAVVDLAIVVVEPAPGRALGVAPFLHLLEQQRIPGLVFINKIDSLGDGELRPVLEALQAQSRRPLVLRQVPIREGGAITGYVDLVSERAYRYRKGEASELIRLPAALQPEETEARTSLAEALADHDDALLEKLLEDAVPSPADLYRPLHADMEAATVDAVLIGAAERDHGIRRLWKALRHDVPAMAATARQRGIAAEGEALAQVFRTVHAGHGGRLSYARVWRGPLKDGAALNGGRIGGITRFPGGEATKCPEAATGDLVALGRLEGASTGQTLGHGAALPFPAAPPPVYALAVAAEDRKDDVRLSTALQRLVEEDPALSLRFDPELGQTLLSGQGSLHLGHALDRLGKVHGLKVSTAHPRVAYKETIRQPVKQHGRLKRQTGGHGQFADVKLDIAPQPRGAGFLFTDHITGGAVPKKFIPAVAEGAEEALKKGPLGHPVVDVAVTLVDGSFHAVDSSDMAFASATRAGLQEGLAKAHPVLLEPVDHVTVLVPNDFTAGAQRLLSARRGQILGYAEAPDWPGWDEVQALVPTAELHDLIIELRSQTMGLGTYRHHFDHLAETHTAR